MRNNFYIQHPLMAMQDQRMKILVAEEGFKGSGAYWFILEKLALLPEPCATLEYLHPFCTDKGISLSYLKKVIYDYQLFDFLADGSFTPSKLNPARNLQQEVEENTKNAMKSMPKTAKNTPKNAKKASKTAEKASKTVENMQKTVENTPKNSTFDAKNDEKRQKTPQKVSKKATDESHNTQCSCVLPNTDNNNTKENIKDIITTTTTTEKRETAAAAAVTDGTLPLQPIRPWHELVNNLAEESTWLEIAYMQSGFSTLLQRNIRHAIEIFKLHIEAYDKGGELLNMSNVHSYFMNYVRAGSRTSATLRQALTEYEARQPKARPTDPYRYEQRIDGKRTYLGCPIPPYAPPRPDATALWNDHTHRWVSSSKKTDTDH